MIDVATKPARRLLDELIVRHLSVGQKLTVSQFAEAKRVIVDKNAARRGKWSNAFAPNLVAPMDAFSDPVVRHISTMKPTQCGGTEIVINCILWAICYAPGDMFWVWSNKENSKEFGQGRFLPNLKACAPAAAHLTGSIHDERGEDLKLDNMTIWWRGSPPHGQGIRSLESWPARYVGNDELDRCDPDTPEWMEKRTETFPTKKKLIDLGSPGLEDAGIDLQVKRSAGGGLWYWTPCPSCGAHYVRDFEMTHWIGGRSREVEKVRAETWLLCPVCDERILGYQNAEMVKGGVWAPGWDVRKMRQALDSATGAGAKERAVRALMPPPEEIDRCLHAEHVGFRIGLYERPFSHNPYGDVAAEHVNNGCIRTESWITHKCGRPWSIKGNRADEHELRRLCTPVELGGYRLGTVPAGVLCIATSIDVGEKEAWVIVRGWGRRGGESWLIDARRVQLPVDPQRGGMGSLAALDGFVRKRYPLDPRWCDEHGEVSRGGTHMQNVLTVADSGDGDRTVDVYNWVKRMGGRAVNVFACKGQGHGPSGGGGGGGGQKTQWMSPTETPTAGKAPPGFRPQLLLNVNTHHWKSWVLARLTRQALEVAQETLAGHGGLSGGAMGAGDTLGGGGMDVCVYRFPEAVYEPGAEPGTSSAERMEQYFAQMTSEEKQPVIDRLGRKKLQWVKKTRANHYWDDEVYNAAAIAQIAKGGADLVRCWGLCAGGGEGGGESTKFKVQSSSSDPRPETRSPEPGLPGRRAPGFMDRFRRG